MTCDCRDTRLAIIRLKSRSITAPRAETIQNRCSLILRMIASWSRSARIALRKAYAQQAPSAIGIELALIEEDEAGQLIQFKLQGAAREVAVVGHQILQMPGGHPTGPAAQAKARQGGALVAILLVKLHQLMELAINGGVGLQMIQPKLAQQSGGLGTLLTFQPGAVTARKDDAPAADQAATTNLAGLMPISG